MHKILKIYVEQSKILKHQRNFPQNVGLKMCDSLPNCVRHDMPTNIAIPRDYLIVCMQFTTHPAYKWKFNKEMNEFEVYLYEATHNNVGFFYFCQCFYNPINTQRIVLYAL